jgi:hypothetical protein
LFVMFLHKVAAAGQTDLESQIQVY